MIKRTVQVNDTTVQGMHMVAGEMIKRTVQVNDTTVQGMHMVVGVVTSGKMDECIDAWNNVTFENGNVKHEIGYDNFFIYLSQYASVLGSIHTQLLEEEDAFDGLFCGEVSENFGRWFANYVAVHAEPPSHKKAINKINKLVGKFINNK